MSVRENWHSHRRRRDTGRRPAPSPHSLRPGKLLKKTRQLLLARNNTHPKAASQLQTVFTLEDLLTVLQDAQKRYDGRSKSRVRRVLASFTSRVMHYSSVMDVVVQHHPEYTSLAWGTMKFMFVLSQNHEELITELANSLTCLSRLLPRIDVQVNLYQASSMQHAAERLYGLLIQDLQAMINWYEEGRLAHAWTSFIKPSSLRFNTIATEFDRAARELEQWAIALSQLEQRHMYELLQTVRAEQQVSEKQQKHMTQLLVRLHGKVDDHHDLAMQDMKILETTTQDTQAAQMIHLAGLDDESQDLVRKRLAIYKRQAGPHRVDLDLTLQALNLKLWSEPAECRLLRITGDHACRAGVRAFGAYLVSILRTLEVPALCVLPSIGVGREKKLTLTQVLRCLTLQSLKFNVSGWLARISDGFNSVRIASASTAEHWLQLLSATLEGLSLVYIVVDVDMVDPVDHGLSSRPDFSHFWQSLQSACPTITIKLALLSTRRTAPRMVYANDVLHLSRGSATTVSKPSSLVPRGKLLRKFAKRIPRTLHGQTSGFAL